MDMEQNKSLREETTLSAARHLTTVSHEVGSDFTLPDYMPAIRRVIHVEASVLPDNRFLSGSALEFGGTVAYSVLYIGEGGELFSAPLTEEYTASTALPEDAAVDAAAAAMDTAVENVTCRVTAPRRLTLRCRMKTKIAVLLPRTVTERLSVAGGGRLTPADEIAIERLTETAHDTLLSRGELTAAVSGTLPARGKVIRCSGAVRVEEAVAGAGAVTARGDVIVTAIFLTPEGTYTCQSAKIPFSETVTVPDAEAGDGARAFGRAASVSVTPGEDGSTWEIEYDLEAESARACVRSYTADLFSTDCAAAVEWEEADSLRLLRCGQGALTVTGEGGRQSKAASGETVLDTRAVCTPERVEVQNGRLAVSGSCAVTVLLLSDGDVISEEFTLPFRYECESAAEAADLLWRCHVGTVDASARPEGDKLSVRLELSVSLCALGKSRIRFVDAAVLNKAAVPAKDDGCIRICYPDPGETLWEIAKRYGVSRRTLCVQNGLPDTETVCDGAPILI